MNNGNFGVYYQEHFIISFPNEHKKNSADFTSELMKVTKDFQEKMFAEISKYKLPVETTKINVSNCDGVSVQSGIIGLNFIFEASLRGNNVLFMHYDIISLTDDQIKEDRHGAKNIETNFKKFEEKYMLSDFYDKENYILVKEVTTSILKEVLKELKSSKLEIFENIDSPWSELEKY